MRWLVVVAALGAVGCPGKPNLCGDLGAVGCQSGTVAYSCYNGQVYDMPCMPGTVCIAGSCMPPVCTAGDFTCDGQTATNCNSDGTMQSTVDCSATGAVCVIGPLSATCENFACTPSQTYCAPDGSEVRKCNPDGTGYTVVQSCDDTDMRGNTCVGSVCVDRCTLVEAHDRSTVGCRFMAPQVSQIVIVNIQPDLQAEVTVDTSTRFIDANQVGMLTPLGAGAVTVTSSLPVMVWAVNSAPSAGTTILHPIHTWSTSHFVAADIDATRSLVVVSDQATTVTVDGTMSSVVAGGHLTVAGGGTVVTATTPVGVFLVGNDGSLAAIPGDETLGTSFVVLDGYTLFARNATTVTNGGMTSLVAGQQMTTTAGTLTTSAPVLITNQGVHIPPLVAWRNSAASFGATCTLVAATPATVTDGSDTIDLSLISGYAEGSGMLTGTVTANQPFFSVCTGGFSLGYGLDIIP